MKHTTGLFVSIMLMISILTSCSFSKKEKYSTDHHVVITYLTLGGKPTNNSGTTMMLEKLNEILTKKVNAELEIYYISWTDYVTYYNLKLAEKDGSIDLIGTATDWLNAWMNAEQGNFMFLSEDMLKTYAPKTWESVPENHWNTCKLNGKIVMMPEDSYSQWTNHGFMYRGDFAKEAGLANGVHSWEDMTTYIKYVRAAKPNMVPWMSNGSESSYQAYGYIQSKSDYIILDGISSYNMFGTRRSNLKKIYSPFYEGDELIDYAKLMKSWDDLGAWPKDVMAYSARTNDSRESFYQGKSAMEQHHAQTWYTTVRNKLESSIPGADCQFFWFGEESKNITASLITHGAMALSKSCKNPERALMVYDLIRNDPECYRLLNYGIEGVQYELTADGHRKGIPGAPGITTNFWWGRNDALELRDANSDWDKFDELSKIYATYDRNYPYEQIVWDLSGVSSELDAVTTVMGNYIGNICYGQESDPEAYVKALRNDLKNAGIEKVISYFQKQLDAFYEKQ